MSHIVRDEAARSACGDTGNAATFSLERVSYVASGRPLLQSITLAIEPACVTGLVGHNGSGKSTLVKLLARQLAPTAGTIRYAGKPLADWGARQFARQVAYLPQQTPPTDGMTVHELVALGRYPWHGALGRFGDEDAEHVERAMRAADVLRHADRPVDVLSGGERQRAWLAMLVAQDCRCMLLDEPTSALDLNHQLSVLELVRTLCATRAMSAVVVLHDVNMAARFCDRIVALREGRLLMRERAADIMDPVHLESIYGVPMRVSADPVSGRRLGFPA
ncbi:ATP-binding cassette domain-containing protein [Burkholderia cepacia]|uniref:ATP-binding cassette domain-containing protein n=1 Tax=Burkholderia cepacia TaxID=292 RepID=A0AAQ2BUC0_BURCE|nr:ATP-binding cassette domain-containing protein [Burkholderia cepacia]MCA7931041.1 ATP-binding cassette domain-containing protein [Burkholderia cepacia]MCA8054530.1 ATP-binding cassette domain-containing protein [Burkholderia cepacia]MCA8131232.1 ATP-binding cassette domain-containing protein [Burkholderia cepacia]MCA8159251.1 ATP-binding cassette domain-containing protein [Burkholderia cepacia]MDN7611346.1 ATP-binding cassette domain-containing protein [Burkholderia cepacia]